MNGVKLRDILEKREEIMTKNDEYIQVPDDNDVDDASHTEKILYREKKELMKYTFGKSMHELTEAVKSYLDKERTRKINWAIGGYFVSFVGISGLIVFNDYILINYIL